MSKGFARIAGLGLKMFGRGVEGGKLPTGVSQIGGKTGAFLSGMHRAGSVYDSPVGNYLSNSLADAALGTLWGEQPVAALGRSLVGNIGGTAVDKGLSTVLNKVGVGAQPAAVLGAFANQAGYAATEIAASKMFPGLYGLDQNGQYVGDAPAAGTTPQTQQQMLPGQPVMLPPSQGYALSPTAQAAAQSDYFYDSLDKQRRAQEKLAQTNYRRSLDASGMSGMNMLPPGVPGLDQSYMYGGMQ